MTDAINQNLDQEETVTQSYPSIAQSWVILGIMIGTALFLVPALVFGALLFGLDFSGMSFGAQILITTLMGTGIPCWIV